MINRKYAKSFPALRVSQLDASDLDDGIKEILTSRFRNIFSYCYPGLSQKVDPEIELFLKCILWKYCINRNGYSLGQQMMNLQYMEISNSSHFDILSKKKRFCYALINIIFVWIHKRNNILLSKLMKLSDHTILYIAKIKSFYNLLNLINFLMFIYYGHYLNLTERLLQIRSRFLKPQSFRQINFEYMNRELIWHGFAESFSVIISTINFNKIKNTLNRFMIKNQDRGNINNSRTESDYKNCPFCFLWPTTPHEIGCQHVFCYICIKSNYMLDQDITCPLCGVKILSENDIKPVIFTMK